MADIEEIFQEYDDGERPDVENSKCFACNGTGISWEGWDCEECDGLGYFEL